MALSQDHDPILRSPEVRTENSYGRNSYPQTGTTVQQIRLLLGEETFWRAFRRYAERWRFDHPTSEDFFDFMRASGNPVVSDLIRKTWYGRGWLDFSILEAKTVADDGFTGFDDADKPVNFDPDPKKKPPKKPGDKKHKGPWQSLVTVGRRRHRMPANVVLTFKDGTTVKHVDGATADRHRVTSSSPLVKPRWTPSAGPSSTGTRGTTRVHVEVRRAVGDREGAGLRPASRGDRPPHAAGCSVSAFSSGVSASLRNRRLAGVLWLSLFASALVTAHPIHALLRKLDDGAFRDALLKGWDGWAFVSFLVTEDRAIGIALASLGVALLVFGFVTVFLTGGVLRALIGGKPRPVFRLVVAEPRGSSRRTLGDDPLRDRGPVLLRALVGCRRRSSRRSADRGSPYVCSRAALLVDARGRAIVLLNVALRYDLARVALARGEAVNARGAFRVAKRRIRGGRPSVILLALLWLAIAVVIQALFTSWGLKWNPQTNGSTFGLFVFRQIGFFFLAMVRVGFWASLLAWEDKRRPAPSLYGI